jgi:glutaredoxin 3
MKKIEIYSTPTCHFCHLAKDFFDDNKIEYTEYNVAQDTEKRVEMMQKTGQLGVPVIVIDEDVVVGFNEPHIRQLLGV